MSDHCSPCPVMSRVRMTLSIGGQEIPGEQFVTTPTYNGYRNNRLHLNSWKLRLR